MSLRLPDGVTVDEGRGGLARVTVDTRACSAELYLQGAHLCAWRPADAAHPVLWMSAASRFEAGAPIRGGVPICFPWFGPNPEVPTAPPHGVARLLPWTLDAAESGADGAVTLCLGLGGDVLSRALGGASYALTYTVTLGRSLSMALSVRNTGTTAVTFAEALHTYLAVSDVRAVAVAGLQGATYLDKTDGGQRKVDGDAAVGITAETDRLYLDTDATLVMSDPGFGRRIRVSKSGSRSSVVWNPWVAKSRAMPDFGDDEWPGMICLETVNAVDNSITRAPGEGHTMGAVVSVEPA